MYRIVGLAVAALLLSGCGQYGVPGAQAAGPAVVVETTYAQVAAAPPPVVIHEVRYESPPVVNTNYINTAPPVVVQPAVERVVVSEEPHRYYRHAYRRPLFLGPIEFRFFGGPRGHRPPPPHWRGRRDEGGRRREPPDNHGRNRPGPPPGGRRGGGGGRG